MPARKDIYVINGESYTVQHVSQQDSNTMLPAAVNVILYGSCFIYFLWVVYCACFNVRLSAFLNFF